VEVFRCQDQWGRDIILTDERWYGKIRHLHPEITEDAIWLTLTDPDLVNWDKSLEGVEVFYREVVLPPPDGASLVKVCVHFRVDEVETIEVGLVTTAYSEFNVNPEERHKWSRDEPSR
jgi:hypothetical protein